MEDMLGCPNLRCKIASCNINQWALDFDGNLKRTMKSIQQAKEQGATLRVGPELEISGYSCEDHFLEMDTFLHCYQSLATILTSDVTDGILCDIGCPFMFNNVRYNCRIFCLNRKIVLIRPKIFMADDGNYRERRFFTSWKNYGLDGQPIVLQECPLPKLIAEAIGQQTAPIGYGLIRTSEALVAAEVCEELWASNSPHIQMYLAGVDIICNGSGSHHELRKLNSRLALMMNATRRCGGVYVYANQRGCDGNRLYFDGCSLICSNGSLLAQASQFSLVDVEVVTAIVDLKDIKTFRNSSASLQEQSSLVPMFPIIDLSHFSLALGGSGGFLAIADILQHPATEPIEPRIHEPQEECCRGPACWMWDYLRRSNASGFLLPLSGGADSSSVATIVKTMCDMVAEADASGNAEVQADVDALMKRTLGERGALALTADEVSAVVGASARKKVTSEEICNVVLHTVYMGTVNSSNATNQRSVNLASAIGAYHSSIAIDPIVEGVLTVFGMLSGARGRPQFECNGGTPAEDLALQNIQARIRMVMAYLCGQLLPWVRGRKGFLLILGSANVDEALRGYMTKYDCSSADLNPIGAISKGDLKAMLLWCAGKYNLPVLSEIVTAPPTAELRPIAEGETNDYTQTDEEDMGMSYADLGIYGRLRKISRCGPVSMFLKLLEIWKELTPTQIRDKVWKFFFYYGINRHKMTTLTPSYHAEGYSPCDNRFDLRQFLYPMWQRQFATIDKIIASSDKSIPKTKREE